MRKIEGNSAFFNGRSDCAASPGLREACVMQIEDDFDFVSVDEIRLRGTRVGIESVLSEYLAGVLPEEIVLNYPPLTLEQIHATITYYLGHRSEMDQYLGRRAMQSDAALERQSQSGSPLLERLAAARRSGTPA